MSIGTSTHNPNTGPHTTTQATQHTTSTGRHREAQLPTNTPATQQERSAAQRLRITMAA